jgi:hypothetical protein
MNNDKGYTAHELMLMSIRQSPTAEELVTCQDLTSLDTGKVSFTEQDIETVIEYASICFGIPKRFLR